MTAAVSPAATLTVRLATPADAPLVCELIRELAAFEKATADDVRTTSGALAAALASDASPRLSAVLAFSGDELTGVALFFPTYSTWRAGWGLRLEDLFVRPAHRRQGIGRALVRAVAAETVARGAVHLEWGVRDANERALAFCDGIGADRLSAQVRMRLAGDALARLAEGA